MASRGYEFRPMSSADLPLVRRWLETPHVAEWWGNPDVQFVLVRDDLKHPDMQQFILAKDDRPFAYLQCYDPTVWPVESFGAQPIGTRGIDQFIGVPEMIGCGHGSIFIRMFVDDLLAAGTPRVLTDPDPVNARAVRAYENAGFHKERLVDTPEGPALLMVRDA